MLHYRVSIDTGGTFTDIVVSDASGVTRLFKVPTTPNDAYECLTSGLGRASMGLGLSFSEFLAQTSLIIFGTTLATNALLTRNLAKTAMITTEGFKDVIYFRTGKRYGISAYDYRVDFTQPLIPGYLRIGMNERMSFDGSVITPLDPFEVRRAVQSLKERGVKSIAICFMHSYANPSHELRAAEICRQEFPDIFVTASSEVLPHMREYERFSSTVISALIGPLFAGFLSRVEDALHRKGFKGSFLVMQSNGGLATSREILKRAALTISSGPSGGAISAEFYSRNINRDNIVSTDMGGTSLDICIVKEGIVETTANQSFGSDLIAFKTLDVRSIGAGGGSIVSFDHMDLLQIGPKSAGAVPGPICYGKGGSDITVTDANLILGYLPVDNYLGGEMKLDYDSAKDSMKKIADRLGTDVLGASLAIHTITNSKMASEITAFLIRRGCDPRDFSLIAAGGGGPIHGIDVALRAGISRVIAPKVSAHFCAFGMQYADLKHDYERSYFHKLEGCDVNLANSYFEKMEKEAIETLTAEGVRGEDIVIRRTADIRYVGQHRELEVDVPSGVLDHATLNRVRRAFDEKHEKTLLFSTKETPVEFVYLRVSAIGKTSKPALSKVPVGAAPVEHAIKSTRPCYFEKSGLVETTVYDGRRLRFHNLIDGPAILEEPTFTVVLHSGWRCTVGEYGDYELNKIR
ncbi:MAG: hydantoinase/oxoprolinase family protein [Nitrososphaerales archaeon]